MLTPPRQPFGIGMVLAVTVLGSACSAVPPTAHPRAAHPRQHPAHDFLTSQVCP